MKMILLLQMLFVTTIAYSQATEKPFIKLQNPSTENNSVNAEKQFIIGSVCKTCNLTVNGTAVKVYATGGFAYQLNLNAGSNDFNLVALAEGGKSVAKKISYNYTIPEKPKPVNTLSIASIVTYPEGNLLLQAGDKIKFKVIAFSGCKAVVNQNIVLYEMPEEMPGTYQGEYVVKETDSFLVTKLPVTITDKTGRSVTKETKNTFSMFLQSNPTIAVTKGKLAHLLFGLGEDRLGGAKIGYLDSDVVLNVVGKVGSKYKVQLSKYRTAFINEDEIKFLPKGNFSPESLTKNFRIYGDSNYDYVALALETKLPYQSMQLINPSKIVVDIFGATNNTNWITQLENTKEITNVFYEQIETEVFRITIELKHTQHWGHHIYYNGNNLVIKINRQPVDLSLNTLTIAIDAGHGGSNNGATGPTGAAEKDLVLAVALKLQNKLEQLGAKIIMTRTTDKSFNNNDRILYYREKKPDLLVSIHLNSAGNPLTASGTSTFYRYIGFRNLSHNIYKRMLELGLKEYGNNGSFNFMLNSPIEYPNALIEMLFLSNPEEEEKILDTNFQQQIADKIALGLQDFLEECKKN